MIVGIRFLKTKTKYQGGKLKRVRLWLYPKIYFFNLDDVKVSYEGKPGLTTALDDRVRLEDFVIVKGQMWNGKTGYVIGQVAEIYEKDDIKPQQSILKVLRLNISIFRSLMKSDPNQAEIRLYQWLKRDLYKFMKLQKRNKKLVAEGKK